MSTTLHVTPERRRFLRALLGGALTVPGVVLAAGACARAAPAVASPPPSRQRLPIAFSTLGCPAWSWGQVLDFAATHGYAGIELRGLHGTMELPGVAEFAPARMGTTRRQLADHALQVACLGSSANMHEREPARRAAAMDEGRRYVDLAHALGAPYVRVFGNEFVPGVSRADTIAHVAAGLRALGAHARGSGVMVLLETHGDFVHAPTLVDVMRQADSDAVGLLWDAHHTYVAGEAPDATARQLMTWVRHTHLKDSRPAARDRRYVLTGTGEVPVRAQCDVLRRHGYRGLFTFEWEKRWHPEIEEPEIAIAHFAGVARTYLGADG